MCCFKYINIFIIKCEKERSQDPIWFVIMALEIVFSSLSTPLRDQGSSLLQSLTPEALEDNSPDWLMVTSLDLWPGTDNLLTYVMLQLLSPKVEDALATLPLD